MSEPVSAQMMEMIRTRLSDLAQEEGIRILLAVESGSRAWGFHSPDSDYDVRFIYVRPVDWHLELGKKRDVVERPIDDELDLSGWDLGKALGLAIGSNAVIAEWLQSPVVYRADENAVADLTRFCRAALSRRHVSWHYLSLLQRQQERLVGPGGGVRLKRYFYVLRPALALRWMRVNEAGMPPMNMAALVSGASLGGGETSAIQDLIERKKHVSESGEEAASNPLLDDVIEMEVRMAKDWLDSPDRPEAPDNLWGEANRLHRHYVKAFS